MSKIKTLHEDYPSLKQFSFEELIDTIKTLKDCYGKISNSAFLCDNLGVLLRNKAVDSVVWAEQAEWFCRLNEELGILPDSKHHYIGWWVSSGSAVRQLHLKTLVQRIEEELEKEPVDA